MVIADVLVVRAVFRELLDPAVCDHSAFELQLLFVRGSFSSFERAEHAEPSFPRTLVCVVCVEELPVVDKC